MQTFEIAQTEYPALDLEQNAKNDETFNQLLVASLNQARIQGQSNLDAALFNALDWPVTVDGYVTFLQDFLRYIPQQSKDPAWSNPATQHSQEVYDRLCHFYYLIDQPVGSGGSKIVQDIPWFSDWLVSYANAWGRFLNTTDSFNDEVLQSFINYSPKYRVEDSMVNGKPNNPSGWLTFNQFFARELNPGLRPISSPISNDIVTCPADCTYRMKYDIAADSSIPEIRIKQTHAFANIRDLLKGSQYADSFANGSFVHYFLGPYSYHRFHTPVAGILKECYAIQGLTYLDVNISANQFDAPDNSEGGYEFSQARGVVTIDTTNSPYGNVGVVAVIPVGMCQVSSVNMTAKPGSEVLKGDEFGYFLFGGSDIIVLFQEGISPEIDTGDQYRLYGTPIAQIG